MPWITSTVYILVLIALAVPLGRWMTRVFDGRSTGLDRALGPLERMIWRLSGADPSREMGWKGYAAAMLMFNLAGTAIVYALQRVQHLLPLNPDGLGPVSPDSALNTAVSFATNTNWQGYGGESTMSHLTQMAGLAVQNFVSAASGIATAVAFIRGFTRKSSATIGNFWFDLVRATVHILLPLSIVLALLLVSQGVVQKFGPAVHATVLDPGHDAAGAVISAQDIPMGPVASQIAVKQLGTNGGGFFSVNSAHPFENPTPLSNFFEVIAILLIPAALCFTFGGLVKDARQGRAVFLAMLLLFVPALACTLCAEHSGNPTLAHAGADVTASALQGGGNMEGKETRFGVTDSVVWAVATTAASNGSVNSMHDSFTPLGGLVPMLLIQFGEVVFGGVGSGLYGMLVFAIVAVFVAGLMVGRTPEYLGKKIEAFEMKMASLVVLVPVLVVLVGTAIAVVHPDGKAGVGNPGPHGFSEILYALSSAGNNNGSAFAGLSSNTPFWNTLLAVAMFLGRYFLAIPVLAMAGSFAAKKTIPPGPGTLPTHGPLFVVLLTGTVVLVAALTFLPALALGPVVEHLLMGR